MNYIDKLNALRVRKGLNVREIGFMCELSEASVRKILYKKCAPLVSSVEKICAVLGISLSELFCETDEAGIKMS